MRRLTLLLLVPLALLVLPATAEIFKTTDKDGNVVFTDRPTPGDANGTETVEVSPINTVKPPQAIPALEPEPEPEPEAIPLTVSITEPANETIIPNGPGNFSVSAEPSQALGANEQFQLFIDGTAHGEPQASGQWALTNIFRGEHNLTVALVDKSGKTLAKSEAVTVFVFRPSSQ